MYDKITEVTKAVEVEENIDVIEHVEKFNPFHDSRGRFSSARGMASYSANPKTRAGAMAIGRSASAGHTGVQNIHRESKGETIGQNDTWLKTGQKPGPISQRANQLKQQKQKQWRQQQNQAQKQTAAIRNNPQAQAQIQQRKQQWKQNQQAKQQAQQNQQVQTGTAAKTALAQQVSANGAVTPTKNQKIAAQARDYNGRKANTTKVCDDRHVDIVKGKDISDTFSMDTGSKVSAIDQVKKAQGWDKGSTVTNDLDMFHQAAAQSGYLAYRSMNGEKGKTANQLFDHIINDGDATLGGSGAAWYGGGQYMVGANIKDASSSGLGSKAAKSQNHSFAYGNTQMMATFHPNANVASAATSSRLASQFSGLSRAERAKYGHDVGAYIASKGYDGACWHDRTDPYLTIYNRSALIYYGGSYNS